MCQRIQDTIKPRKAFKSAKICDRETIARFRSSIHSLEVETRRFRNRLDRPLRICRNCHNVKVEDEIHLLLMCPAYEENRKQYINSKFLVNRNQINFDKLICTQSMENLKENCKVLYSWIFSQTFIILICTLLRSIPI